jgi:anaerobic selenocysteine-containing dehydrogenase
MVNLTEKIIEIPGVCDEYTLWHDLAQRLGLAERYFPWKNEEEVNRWILEPTGINLEELKKHPSGYFFKPVRYKKHLKKPLPTPSGKLEFASPYLKQMGLSEIPEYVQPFHIRNGNEKFPFVLTTGARKSLFYHSRHQNIPRFRTVYPAAEVEIHPADAAKLGIQDNDLVRVTSAIGKIEIRAAVKHPSELRQGVIEIYHGWEEWRVNYLTYDNINDPISGFPLLKAVPVQVEKIPE